MRYAEAGFALEINLSRGNIEKVATDPEETRLYLGGEGAAAKLLWDRVPPDIDPFAPGNLLIFSAGTLDGTQVPGANRTSVSTISPQSNLYVNAGLGGFFGPELKQAGYDRIVLSGKSPELVYLWIHDDEVEIRDAGHLQGKSPLETAALIRQELHDAKIQVAAIGLAGENRVCQASIEHGNSSASRGVGVVMGDKRLKAIAVRGSKDLRVARPGELSELSDTQFQGIYDNPNCGDVFLNRDDDAWHANSPPWVHPDGRVQGYWTEELEERWSLSVERVEVHQQWENYSQEMEEVRETVVDKSRRLRGTGCYNCPKQCHQALYLPGGRTYFLKNYGKLAYAMAAYPDLKLNYDVLAALQDYGLDEFAMPQVLCFVVQLYQTGVLTDQELPDFPADGAERFLYLIGKVARREGVGDALANGIARAASRIGKGAGEFAKTAKGVELVPLAPEIAGSPYYLMAAAGGKLSITQIEGSFPQLPIGDRSERERFVRHWEAAPERFKGWFSAWEPGQQLSVEAAVNIADWNEAMHYADDCLGICPLLSSFRGQYGGRPPYHLHNLPGYIAAATGMAVDSEGLWEVCGRVGQLVRAINVRRGLRRSDDTAPGDHWQLSEAERETLLDAYYRFKGWDSDGVPTRKTLESLGLDYLSEGLGGKG